MQAGTDLSCPYTTTILLFFNIRLDDTVNFEVNECDTYMPNSKYLNKLRNQLYINIATAAAICSLRMESILYILVPWQ